MMVTGRLAICEGHLLFGSFRKGAVACRKAAGVSQKLVTGDIIGLVVNLDGSSPNAFTLSLFQNGTRVSAPQVLPQTFKAPQTGSERLEIHRNGQPRGPKPVGNRSFSPS